MNPEVVAIALGYIGLPTSALIASHGTNVLGVDINPNYAIDRCAILQVTTFGFS